MILAAKPASGGNFLPAENPGFPTDEFRETLPVCRIPASADMPALFLILACALWGLSFPVIKALHIEQSARLPDAGSGFLSAWIQVARFGLGAMILLPFGFRGGGPTRMELRQGLRLGFWGGTGLALQADGLAHTEASTSAFLTQAFCVILPLVVCFRLRRAPNFRTVMATMMVMTGCAILSGFSPSSPGIGRGELVTLLAAVFITFQILTLENPMFRGNRSTQVTLVMCASVVVIFVPVSAFSAPSASALLAAGASWTACGLIAVLAACCSVGAFLLMNHWQPRMPAVEAGLLYTTEPVFAAIYVLFLPAWIGGLTGSDYANESLTPSLLLGGVLILAANVWMQLTRPPHSPSIAPGP